MIRSPAYRALSLPARCLLVELQDVWRPSEPAVHYALRSATKALNVGMATAARAFKELLSGGFITVAKDSDLIERKAREYRLTWLSTDGREPTDEWEEAAKPNGKTNPAFRLSSREAPICYQPEAEAPKRAPGRTKNQRLTSDFHPLSATETEHH